MFDLEASGDRPRFDLQFLVVDAKERLLTRMRIYTNPLNTEFLQQEAITQTNQHKMVESTKLKHLYQAMLAKYFTTVYTNKALPILFTEKPIEQALAKISFEVTVSFAFWGRICMVCRVS